MGFPDFGKPQSLCRQWLSLRPSLLTDNRDDPDRYLIIVLFDSYESAMERSKLSAEEIPMANLTVKSVDSHDAQPK